MELEKRILQIGGAAGLLAGVLFALTIALVTILPSPLPGGNPDPDVFLGTLFPENSTLFLAIGLAGLTAYLLTALLFLALHRSLKEVSPTFATGALLLYFLYLGFITVAPGELVAHLFVTPQLAAQYGAASTDAGRAIITQTFHTLNLMSDQMFFVGLLFCFLSAITFGVVMGGSPTYGRTFGAIIVLVGVVGILTLPTIVLEAGIRVPFVPFALWFLLGGRVYLLSRTARDPGQPSSAA